MTLDRVVNVYPDWERLLELSAARAKRLYGLVYPRDRPFVRLVISVINTRLRLSGQQLRAAVRPADAIDQILRDSGLTLRVSESVGPACQVAVYRRG